MKKIIYLGTKVYGYEKEIIDELEERGYKVFFIDMIPSRKVFYFKKIISIFLGKKISNKFLEKQVDKIINKRLKEENLKNLEIEKIFTIGWGYLSLNNLLNINKQLTIKDRVLYLWENSEKLLNLKEYYKYFDRVYSFDLKDCQEYGFEFRPTFYSKELEGQEKKNMEYNFSFIGSYSFERLKKVLSLENIVQEDLFSYKNNIYLYVNFKYFLLHLIYNFKIYYNSYYLIKGRVKFKPLDRRQYKDILKSSNQIIDIIGSSQRGLTQRALDSLYLNKKFLTNQSNIEYYRFYNKKNIYIFDKKFDYKLFNQEKMEKISEEIKNLYCIKTWANVIFENEKISLDKYIDIDKFNAKRLKENI